MDAPTYRELREMTEDELIRTHDEHAERTMVGQGFFLDEIIRRQVDRSTQKIVCWTRVILYATLVNLIFVVVSTLSALGVI